VLKDSNVTQQAHIGKLQNSLREHEQELSLLRSQIKKQDLHEIYLRDLKSENELLKAEVDMLKRELRTTTDWKKEKLREQQEIDSFIQQHHIDDKGNVH